MKRLLFVITLALPLFGFAGNNPTIVGGLVPQVMEGTATTTNNNRLVCWFWLDLSGLTPNATYHYYTAMDTANAAVGSNGAGNPVLINETTRNIRRITNPAMTANTGYDSLTADSSGNYSGWFAVEPTSNARFSAGNTVHPKLMMNNGAGGTTVAYRLDAVNFPISIISFGTTASSTTQGSALFDSLDAAPKNFICLYDNTTASGRPVNIGIVEDDTLYLKQFNSTATFYRNRVDSLPFHWGAIIPNNLPNGIRSLEERDFTTGSPVDTVMDADGFWCFGTNTVNMSNGTTALFLNSTFVLNPVYLMPDTTWTGFSSTFTANGFSPNASYSWDFGDSNTGTGSPATHTYANPGVYLVTLVVSTGGCSDTITHTVIVLLSTDIKFVPSLYFSLTPNPTSGEFRMTTKDANPKTIIITNMLGETISTDKMTSNTITLDLTGQQSGIYFVRVKDEVTGRTGTRKIILQ